MLGTAVSWILFSSFLKMVTSEAYLSLKFENFGNPGGRDSSGRCCDVAFMFCASECDHSFRICVDRITGSRYNEYQCAYGAFSSGHITNRNYITFYNYIGSLPNPIVLKMNNWPGQVLLKINVVDFDDHTADDQVDYLYTVISLLPTRSFQNSSLITVVNRVVLTLRARVYCGQYYYGRNCSEYCKPRNDSMGHYSCNQTDGTKTCLNGWTGPSCDIDEDNCNDSFCQNGGVCQDLINTFECNCSSGYEGRLCEQDINECLSQNVCNQGECENTLGSFICKCHIGYTGEACQININDCLSSPCQNGAVCSDLIHDFQCKCPLGFMGKVCDEDINECHHDPCRNNGTCVNHHGGYKCDCLSGYISSDCSLDIDECNHVPCKNGGVCNNFNGGYECQCDIGFEGFNCDIDVNECDNLTMVCHNNGFCINTPGSYTCKCLSGYSGHNCEIDLNECLSHPCKHKSTCHDLPGDYICDCEEGYRDISVPFYLACQITLDTEWTISKGLKQMLLDTQLFQGKELTVSHRTEIKTSNEGEVFTSIYPFVAVDGKLLSDHEMSNVINKLSHKIKDYLHCPVFLKDVQENFSLSTPAMISTNLNWYPAVITICAVLVVVTAVVIFIRYWRGIKVWFQIKMQAKPVEASKSLNGAKHIKYNSSPRMAIQEYEVGQYPYDQIAPRECGSF